MKSVKKNVGSLYLSASHWQYQVEWLEIELLNLCTWLHNLALLWCYWFDTLRLPCWMLHNPTQTGHPDRIFHVFRPLLLAFFFGHAHKSTWKTVRLDSLRALHDSLRDVSLFIVFLSLGLNDFIIVDFTTSNHIIGAQHLNLAVKCATKVGKQVQVSALLSIEPKHFELALLRRVSWMK